MRRSMKNGFTLIDALLGLLTTNIVCILCCMIVACCLKLNTIDLDHQNQFAILQLRDMLAICDSYQIEEDNLNMIINHESIQLVFEKDRLVRKPGYEIFMESVDGYFYDDEDKIYIYYVQGKKSHKFQLY